MEHVQILIITKALIELKPYLCGNLRNEKPHLSIYLVSHFEDAQKATNPWNLINFFNIIILLCWTDHNHGINRNIFLVLSHSESHNDHLIKLCVIFRINVIALFNEIFPIKRDKKLYLINRQMRYYQCCNKESSFLLKFQFFFQLQIFQLNLIHFSYILFSISFIKIVLLVLIRFPASPMLELSKIQCKIELIKMEITPPPRFYITQSHSADKWSIYIREKVKLCMKSFIFISWY